ncbi:hypothetical protein HNR53_002686 [Bacillus benzoevorans]|uniref:Uncharacterized protein n=1 Tax=Bacillus benzoevorans TaxID=1456 RepID=A0A7X0LVI6_9BACI|nr:hypothetical protein [Bacillus benzoevorans]
MKAVILTFRLEEDSILLTKDTAANWASRTYTFETIQSG